MVLKFLLVALLTFFCSCSSPKKSSGYEIGIDPSWYPLQVEGQEKNILAFSIELLIEISKKENLQFSIINMSWDNLLWGLKEQKYDAVLSTMRPYTFYAKKYNFSNLYLKTGPVIVAPEKTDIKNIKDLKGKEVAVVRGSSAALLLQSTPGIILRSYDSIPIVLNNLEKNEVEAAAVEILIAQNFIRNIYHGELKMVTGPISNEGLRLLTLQAKNKKLIERFDSGLKKLEKSGEYEALLTKWGLSPDSKPVSGHMLSTFLSNYTLQ